MGALSNLVLLWDWRLKMRIIQVIPIAAALDDVGECLALQGKYAVGTSFVHEVHGFCRCFLCGLSSR